MTNRERNLLVLLFVVLAGAGLLIAAQAWFETRARLDDEFIALQGRALRIVQSDHGEPPPGSGAALSLLRKRFYSPGSLPEPLGLASLAQSSLERAGLRLVESRIAESSATAQWVRYSVRGDIGAWFRFLQRLRHEDPSTLFRTLSLVRKEGSDYEISFEVGHAVIP